MLLFRLTHAVAFQKDVCASLGYPMEVNSAKEIQVSVESELKQNNVQL